MAERTNRAGDVLKQVPVRVPEYVKAALEEKTGLKATKVLHDYAIQQANEWFRAKGTKPQARAKSDRITFNGKDVTLSDLAAALKLVTEVPA
jgi:hypothetical protein